LLTFEDGGAIELPKVRYAQTDRGMRLIASDEISQTETRHSDVCGSIDELKRLLKEQPELAKRPKKLYELVDNTSYMIYRMQKRIKEYEQFETELASLGKQVAGPEPEQAYRAAEEIRNFLQNQPENIKAELEWLYECAENIRKVANEQEKCLATHKNQAIKVGKLYEKIKDGRKWEIKKE